MTASNVSLGKVKSCGCLRREVSTELGKMKRQLDGAQQRVRQLENEVSNAKHNAEREVAAVTAERDELRSDAEFGGGGNPGLSECATCAAEKTAESLWQVLDAMQNRRTAELPVSYKSTGATT